MRVKQRKKKKKKVLMCLRLMYSLTAMYSLHHDLSLRAWSQKLFRHNEKKEKRKEKLKEEIVEKVKRGW